VTEAMHTGSIRRQLLGLLLLSLAVGWVAVAVVTYVYAHREVDALLDAHLRQAARMLVAQAGHEMEELDWEDEDYDGYGGVVAFQIRNADGRVLLRSANAPSRAFSSQTAGFGEARLRGARWRVYSSMTEDGDTIVHVAEDHATRERIARHMALSALVPLLLTIPLLAAVVWWIVGRSLRPLDRLGEQIARRNVDDLAPVRAGTMPAELRPLVDRLDELFARLRDSIDSERRFTSHAAHELRTPLAALRAQAEVALHARDQAVREAALVRCIEGCDRTARLVSQMLLLTRADELSALPNVVPCRLEQIAQSVLAELAPQADSRGCALALDTVGECVVQGDPALLDAMLRNLVDNALRHGGREVDVSLHTSDREVLLRVGDDGPGVPNEALPQLGQRFFRADATSRAGSGLGLSIVQRIASLHGASMRLQNRPRGSGFVASISFPNTSGPR
jgi:two-component system sensor histidine kinase QseC